MRQRITDLWYGRIPLARIFWDYAIIFGSFANLVTTLAALAAFANGLHVAFGLILHFLPTPYNLLMVVGVWRSAAKYRGPRVWAIVSRALILAWAAIATLA